MWCHLHIWGYWYFSLKSWFQLVFLPSILFFMVMYKFFSFLFLFLFLAGRGILITEMESYNTHHSVSSFSHLTILGRYKSYNVFNACTMFYYVRSIHYFYSCLAQCFHSFHFILSLGSPVFPFKIAWRREWQRTPVFLPAESHGQRSLAGYSPCGRIESDMTERPSLSLSVPFTHPSHIQQFRT